MKKIITIILMLILAFGLTVGVKSATAGTYYKFTPVNDGLYGTNVTCIEIDANNPNIVYLGTVNEGIFVSQDSGKTWRWIGKGFEINIPGYTKTYIQINAIKTVKGKPSLIYVGTAKGLFKSSDSGLTFTFNTNLPRKVYSIYVDSNDPNFVLVGTDDGVYKSTDGGVTFEAANKDISNINVLCFLKDYSMKDSYYIGTDKGLYKSIDGCENWLLLNNGISGAVYGITQHSKKPYLLYVSTSTGLYRTYDYGDHFGLLKNGSYLKSYIDSFDDRLILAITRNAILQSNDSGETWNNLYSPMSNTYISDGIPMGVGFGKIYVGTNFGFGIYENGSFSYQNKNLGLLDIKALGYDSNYNYIYAHSNLGLFVKMSNDTSWSYLSGALFGANPHSFAIDPTIPNSMFAGTKYGIMHSTDNGKSWSQLEIQGEFFALTFSEMNPKYLFAGGDSGLYVSKDSGSHFTKVNSFTDLPIYGIAAPSDGSVYILTSNAIYKSNDFGKTFNIINTNVKVLNPTTLSSDKNNPSIIYLGTTGGLYVSKDGCLNFEPFGDLAKNTMVYSVVSLKDGTLYVGTDRGVYIGTIYSDNNPPTLIVNSPQDGTEVNTPSIVISGRVLDNESGVFKLTINGNIVQFDDNGNFSYTLVLVPGENSIDIKAYDFAGNVSLKTLKVTYIKTIVLTLFVGSNKLTSSDGSVITLDSPPVIVEGRTLVPIRPIIEKFGGSISWDGTERKVTIMLGNKTLELWIDKPQARVNGVLTWIDPNNTKVTPKIINGRTMLPVRFVSEQLGAKVEWDGTLRKITITYPAP
ncbi:stalk domain-containing protein [Caldisericum exile]|uniref:stalk domain-containing protein n=1 Tax=Caldisericum exile TaxID=693075 RepID=UPI003C746FAA